MCFEKRNYYFLKTNNIYSSKKRKKKEQKVSSYNFPFLLRKYLTELEKPNSFSLVVSNSSAHLTNVSKCLLLALAFQIYHNKSTISPFSSSFKRVVPGFYCP